MTREHTPRPGVTWQEQSARRETVVRDEDGAPWVVTPWLGPDPEPLFEPVVPMNREDRRREMRAQRKGGRR